MFFVETAKKCKFGLLVFLFKNMLQSKKINRKYCSFLGVLTVKQAHYSFVIECYK